MGPGLRDGSGGLFGLGLGEGSSEEPSPLFCVVGGGVDCEPVVVGVLGTSCVLAGVGLGWLDGASVGTAWVPGEAMGPGLGGELGLGDVESAADRLLIAAAAGEGPGDGVGCRVAAGLGLPASPSGVLGGRLH